MINFLIRVFDYSDYLEIGVQRTFQNFDKINAVNKIGIDPTVKADSILRTTSDIYFKSISDSTSFDIIFIDGLHTADQSFRDFENSIKHLNYAGCIVMHDLLPKDTSYTMPNWCGDVWKTGIHFARTYKSVIEPEDHGVGVFFPDLPNELTIPPLTDYPGLVELEKHFHVTSDFQKEINMVVKSIKQQDKHIEANRNEA